jgi:hypothetical protein
VVFLEWRMIETSLTMMAYRVLWLALWGSVAAVCVAVACVVWTPLGVALAFGMIAVTAGGVYSVWSVEVGAAGVSGLRECCRVGMWVAGVGVACLSLADFGGALALPLFALATATSPAAVNLLRRRLRIRRTHRSGRRLRLSLETAAAERAWEQMLCAELADLSDVDLCWAWRTSYRTLGERADAAWRDQVAGVRRAYLTELERRHPVEIAAWLATGPRPAAGPEKFLRAA